MAFIAWLIRAGVIVSFISETVLVGFKTGVALVLAATQLPKLFGFKGGHGSFWENAGYFLSHLRETHPASLATGLAALIVLILGKYFPEEQAGCAICGRSGGILIGTLAHLGRSRREDARGNPAGVAADRIAGGALERSERSASAGDGLFSAGRCGDGGDRANVCV